MNPRKIAAVLAVVTGALVLPAAAAAVPSAPGAPTITAKPKGLVNRTINNRISWTAGSGAATDHYECRVVINGNSSASSWDTCSSGDAFYSAVDATTTVLVRGVGATGLKGAFSQASWKVKNLWVTAIGDITFSGSDPHPGTVLKAGAPTVQDSSGRGSIGYSWWRCISDKWDCQVIDGVAGPYYRLTKDDVGYRIAANATYVSDTNDDSDPSAWGRHNMTSEVTPVVIGDISAQPSLSWSGSLAFGKVISYSIGTFKGGLAPCQPSAGGCPVEAYVTLQYCWNNSGNYECMDSYSMKNGQTAYGVPVLNAQRGNFRLVEGLAVGYHLRLHTHLVYARNNIEQDFYSSITSATVAGPEATVNPTISGTAKKGYQMNSTAGTWINSYIWTGESIYGFYGARPYVDWYRCTSPTNTSTCIPAHRYETAQWWELVGTWSGWRAYTGYRPTAGDVGYYMRTKATMDLWWPLGNQNSGNIGSYESDFGPASAKVVS